MKVETSRIEQTYRYILKRWGEKLPDRLYIRLLYRIRMGKHLHLLFPRTFNEKLQWLKLFYKVEEYTEIVDKVSFRKYIEKKIGSEYLVPMIAVYDRPEQIDVSQLPDQFILKCSHDSGSTIICKDKTLLNMNNVKRELRKKMAADYYSLGREYPYKNIVPKIICEQLLSDQHEDGVLDYKVMCFNGKAKCLFVCSERNNKSGLKVTFFDMNWKRMPFERDHASSKVKIKKPKNFDLMIRLSEKLAEGMPFVRADWYEANDRLYIGELTFFPGNGMERFTPEKYDRILGNWLKLPNKRR